MIRFAMWTEGARINSIFYVDRFEIEFSCFDALVKNRRFVGSNDESYVHFGASRLVS